MKSRVLFFSTTSSVVGGVETWLDRCCAYLSQRGMDPVVGLARGTHFNNPERFRSFHKALNTVEVDGRGLNSEGRIRALVRCIRKVRPAVVLPMGIVEANDAVIRCKRSDGDIRLVVHAQGNLPAMLADLKYYRPGIDHVVCPGDLTRKLLTTWGGFAGIRVSHVPNGADLAVCPHQSRSNGGLRLGYVGRFTRGDKRVLDLVPLYRELTRRKVAFSLRIVGDGPARSELEEAFRGQSNVSLQGPVSHECLYRDVFPNLDVLVLCSASEAFGIALAEAMMNGVVPVTSRYLGYHSEQLVVHEETGLSFGVGDMADAAAQIQRLANDDRLLSALSFRGKEHAEGKFTWERSLSSWHALLERVAAEPALDVTTEFGVARSSTPGRLDALGVPLAVSDIIRRGRRFLFGSSTVAGGEEWPLFCRTHSEAVLREVVDRCYDLDQPASSPSPEV